MDGYGQYCPIARGAEIFANRWTPIIVRNLLVGCRTFTEILDGAPGMPRSLLTERLRQLEHVGVVTRTPSPRRRGFLYELTDAGRELQAVCDALGAWGARWLELTPAHLDAGIVLWSMCQCMDRAGGIATFISADPDNAARAVEIARSEIRRFVQDGPTEAELAAAQNKLASGRTLQAEVPMGRFGPLGAHWVYSHEYCSLEDELAAWLAVTREQIVEVARRFRLDETTLVALGPLEQL